MRKILFRGKRIDTGEWVYGYVAIHTIIGDETELKTVIVQKPDKIYQYDSWTVDPETVGQYTGLKDKNGVKIFEGDILYHPIQGKRKVYYPFSERVASYGLRMIEGKVRMVSTLSEGFLYEVIGNVHDKKKEPYFLAEFPYFL